MLKLLKKIGILITIILGLSILGSLILPYGWADAVQYAKIQHYKSVKGKYNALFFGGSLEYRQINPKIIDGVLNSNQIHFNSYNLGIDGHNIIQQLADIDGIMKIKNDSIKYIFVSMSSEPYFFAYNKNTSKWLAWVNLKSTVNSIFILPNAGRTLKEKTRFIILYIRSYFMNLFKVGMVPDVLTHYLGQDTLYQAYIGPEKNGFFAYDDERTYLAQYNRGLDEDLNTSRARFIQDVHYRDSLRNANTQQFSNYKVTDKPNQEQVNMLYRFMKKYNKMGIDVYFILPPRAMTSYSYLLPIFYALPENRRIELADPRQYPQFYTYENGYNFHHLNKKGAAIFSKVLGNKIADLLMTSSKIPE